MTLGFKTKDENTLRLYCSTLSDTDLLNSPTSLRAYLTALSTALPAYRVAQSQIAHFMAEAAQLNPTERRRLNALYRQTRIEYRHSVLSDYGVAMGDFQFYPNRAGLMPFPTVHQRMQLYRQHALPLAAEAARKCLAERQLSAGDVTHLIWVSCTGMYAPGPDIELITALGLPTSTQRTAINFMGCYGAFNGLKVADAIVRATPTARVLMLSVELCTLHFQNKTEEDHLLANALFADGAAAALIEGKPTSHGSSLELTQFACDLLPEGAGDMAWHISDHGFEMKLTSRVPEVLRSGLPSLLDTLLSAQGLSLSELSHILVHPGGRRILEVVSQALDLPPTAHRWAYEVLRDYGNMSSATILFVLQKLLHSLNSTEEPHPTPWGVACAFGPGLTAETLLFRVVN